MQLFKAINASPKAADDRPAVVDFVDNLMAIRRLQRSGLSFIDTLEDYDIFVVCAYHYLTGKPVNLKCLLSYGIGPSKTIQRRLDRLKRLHILRERVDTADRRTKWLDLEERIVDRLEEVGSAYIEGCISLKRAVTAKPPRVKTPHRPQTTLGCDQTL